MHLVGDDIAWILPTRTGTKTTLLNIGLDHVLKQNNRTWHVVDKSKLGNRKLYMNIRNPYTRLQSAYRMHFSNYKKLGVVKPDKVHKYLRGEKVRPSDMDTVDFSFEEYVLGLKEKRKIYTNYWHLHTKCGVFYYPTPLLEYLVFSKIPSKRVERFIRLETLGDDLRDLGFEPKFKLDETVPESKNIGLDWYEDHPECVDIVNKMYRCDFKTFRYDMIR